MDKEKEIKRVQNKLNKLFADIPKEKQDLVEGLIQNAAFMEVTLLDLQSEVNAKGAMIPCKSGNGFETIKDNPAQKAYTTMIARYSNIINQLEGMLPSSEASAPGAELMKFLSQDDT